MELNVSVFKKSFTEIWSLIRVILDKNIFRNEKVEQAKGSVYATDLWRISNGGRARFHIYRVIKILLIIGYKHAYHGVWSRIKRQPFQFFHN